MKKYVFLLFVFAITVYANQGDLIEPEVTIIRKGETLIEEYRISGSLYMIKVTPARGLPYYMVDNDGDGYMESRTSDMETVAVPQWVLFFW